jgi:hypothetical protein
VTRLLLPHSFEHLGRSGIVFTKSIRVVTVYALVFFFEGDGEGENLTFGEAIESAHLTIVIHQSAL